MFCISIVILETFLDLVEMAVQFWDFSSDRVPFAIIQP